MKLIAISSLLISWAALSVRAEDKRLESVQRAKWVHHDYTNPEYGVSVAVRARTPREKAEAPGGRGTFRVEEANGTKISISTQEDKNEIAEIRVPLDGRTIEYLFTATNEPDYVRFIAASRITDSNLSGNDQLRLLKRGMELPDASLRYYIWHGILEFKPREKVSSLLHLGLCDPCMEIANQCTVAVVNDYKLKAADGSDFEWTPYRTGSSLGHYIREHQEVYEVAKALNRMRPDLLTGVQLEDIRDRAMPSDDWFAFNYSGQESHARDYFRDYATRTKAEQARTGQPATRPESKPCEEKPQPEPKPAYR